LIGAAISGTSTVKASITLHAPHRSVVVAFIGLIIQKYG
jgi:fructose-specific phosphotransferase system IIC component